MIKFRHSLANILIISIAFTGLNSLSEHKNQAKQPKPNQIKKAQSQIPVILRETTENIVQTSSNDQWKSKKQHLLDFAINDEPSLNDLYEETSEWIERDEQGFVKTFKTEIFDAKEINVTAAFFLMNSALKYSSEGETLATMVLSSDRQDEKIDHHHIGDNNSEKMEMLKIHTLNELRKKSNITDDLAKTVTKLVKESSNLAVVREGMELLLKSGELSAQEVASLVSRRPKTEHFAFADLL